MSHLLKQWGRGKYGLWTTVADGYLHDPKKLSKDELLDFIEEMWRDDLEDRIINLRKTFPRGFFDKDTGKRI